MYRNQFTIAEPVQISGTGYWSGLQVNVEFRPAPADAGITFVRKDLGGQPRIPVAPHNCVDIPRRTCIQSGAASVEMIEHIMAALAGLKIDNCEVWVDRAELPAFDGSCIDVVHALNQAGVTDQQVGKPVLEVTEVIRVEQNDSWIVAMPNSLSDDPGCSSLSLRYELEYEAQAIGCQEIELVVTPEAFISELAPARTFLLEKEAAWLQSQGLGRNVSFQDLLVFGENGVIDNQLRFENECVRHKALDVVGDLAVAGFDIAGTIVAHKSGHQLNGKFVRHLTHLFEESGLSKKSA